LRFVLPAVLVFLAFPAGAQAAPGWLSPVNVSGTPSTTLAFAPDVAVDGAGNAIGVWVRNDGTNDRIQAAIRPAGALSFGSPQTISPASKNAFEPRIDTAATGEAVAVWTNTTDNTIQSAYKFTGINLFGPAATISSATSFRPEVSMDPQGNAQAIWIRQLGVDNFVVEAAFQPTGGAFAAPEQLSQANFVSDNPQIAAEQNANASALWTRFDPTTSTSVVQTSARREVNFPRVGGATPYRVPLVPAFAQCTTATQDSNHVAPLDEDSCDPAGIESSRLTLGTGGAGQGSVRFDVVNGNVGTPADEADFRVNASLGDVRCVVGGVSGCVLAGDDYTGQVLLTTSLRLTDLANGVFQDDPATVKDFEFSTPITCVVNPLTTVGSTCTISTTADTLLPNMVKERKRNLISVRSLSIEDAGVDGSITPPAGSCPITCGSGDEKAVAYQGVFLP
jgi:hypothetical protein